MEEPDSGYPELRDRLHTDGRNERWRNRAAFWILGLCNNFAYVVMLSAAHDILKKQSTQNASELVSPTQKAHPANSSTYDCNPVSTAAVLLADILPTMVIKLFTPFVVHKVPYGARVLCCVLMAALSFLLMSFSVAVWMSIVGVICASVSAGLGELSFLSLTVFYSRDVVGAWGSGTGGAGVAGALSYAGLIQAGLSPRLTLLIMLVVPVGMLTSYFFLLAFPPRFPQWRSCQDEYESVASADRRRLINEEEEESDHGSRSGGAALTLPEKFHVIRGLLHFMVPMGLVYFAEYFINQGLMELFFFHNFFLSHVEQYRWYQMLYQVGVLLSRSSLWCMKIRRLWLLALLQVLNAVFLFFAALYQFLPSAWLVFAIILFEGLLGGAAYVNTFYFISKETADRHREFAMAAASVADSLGIALAGVVAFPVHRYFCSL